MSGVNFDGREIRKGAVDAIEKYVDRETAARRRRSCARLVERISRQGGTPLVVADDTRRSA